VTDDECVICGEACDGRGGTGEAFDPEVHGDPFGVENGERMIRNFPDSLRSVEAATRDPEDKTGGVVHTECGLLSGWVFV
jgi:hypothetical protein